MKNSELIDEINKLKKEKNAIILAHNYQPAEIQEIADFLGDSLELCIKASKIEDADIVVFCGVDFMAETASIISPDKKILLPDLGAYCPMADKLKTEELIQAKKENPDAAVVVYVNTLASSKAEADIVCTSANASKVFESLSQDKVIFAPDVNLSQFGNASVNKELMVVPKDGNCYVHKAFKKEDVANIRKEYPDAEVVVHPECDKEVQDAADQVLSTGGMMKLAAESDFETIVLGTEVDIISRLNRECPGKNYVPLRKDAICETMKLHTLEKVRDALRDEKYEVVVDEDIRKKAIVSVQRMLDLA
ncbi:MAG: quinolinate synthase NadA [Methanobacteriaceae archaeon]|nr:quinolinate synthase NadA [Methanobacteriaceae archaeon]